MRGIQDEWSTRRARTVKWDVVPAMHVPSPLGHSLLCFFMRSATLAAFSLFIGQSEFARTMMSVSHDTSN